MPNPQRGLTPLHVAARHGDSLLVMGLLAHGAIGDARSKNGSTPAQMAKGRLEVLCLL